MPETAPQTKGCHCVCTRAQVKVAEKAQSHHFRTLDHDMFKVIIKVLLIPLPKFLVLIQCLSISLGTDISLKCLVDKYFLLVISGIS